MIDKKMSLKACQLEDGDIVCFQRAPEPKRFKRPTVPEFLSYVKNRQARLLPPRALHTHARFTHTRALGAACGGMGPRLLSFNDICI